MIAIANAIHGTAQRILVTVSDIERDPNPSCTPMSHRRSLLLSLIAVTLAVLGMLTAYV